MELLYLVDLFPNLLTNEAFLGKFKAKFSEMTYEEQEKFFKDLETFAAGLKRTEEK